MFLVYAIVIIVLIVIKGNLYLLKLSSLLQVHVPPSCSLDGVHSQHFFGTGIIIYHSSSMGLAVVDKNTVAISASDVMLSFAAFPVEIPGEVRLPANILVHGRKL